MIKLLERCKNYINDYAGVHLRAQLLKDLEAAIAAEQALQTLVDEGQKLGLYEQAKSIHTSKAYPDDGGVTVVYGDEAKPQEPAPLNAPMLWHCPPPY